MKKIPVAGAHGLAAVSSDYGIIEQRNFSANASQKGSIKIKICYNNKVKF